MSTGQWDATIIDRARKLARSRKQDWPGMPLTQVPLDARADLQRLIADGAVRIVERPSAARPGRTATFVVVVPTDA